MKKFEVWSKKDGEEWQWRVEFDSEQEARKYAADREQYGYQFEVR